MLQQHLHQRYIYMSAAEFYFFAERQFMDHISKQKQTKPLDRAQEEMAWFEADRQMFLHLHAQCQTMSDLRAVARQGVQALPGVLICLAMSCPLLNPTCKSDAHLQSIAQQGHALRNTVCMAMPRSRCIYMHLARAHSAQHLSCVVCRCCLSLRCKLKDDRCF